MAGPDEETRGKLRKQGKAMKPAGDNKGRFPIRNRSDLSKAIKAVGRAKGGEEDRRKVRRFIMRRARELDAEKMIPDNWASNGSLKGE